ncbi:MAG: DUF6686 family protein [Bacteroidota bacterium]
MCQPSTLVQEKYGIINRCDSCGIMDMTFGNFSLQMSEEDFCMFLAFINSLCKKYVNRGKNLCRDIKITTKVDNLQLVVCYKELRQLQEMMAEAVLILEAEQLIK